MSKVFKNTKQLLAVAVAIAVVAVSLFTGINVNVDASCDNDGFIVYYSGGISDGAFITDGQHGSGTESDPYIISTPEELSYVHQNMASTSGKYFKVADGIDAFVMQPKGKVDANGGFDVLKDLTAAQVNEWFSSAKNSNGEDWNNWHSSNNYFAGSIDFNGITIYGMSATGDCVALISRIKGGTIKNVAVKSSYISTSNYGGFIAGIDNSWNNSIYDTIENCAVTNCYLVSSKDSEVGSDRYQASGLLGGALFGNTTINNCWVSDSVAVHTDGTELAFLGKTQNNATSISNTVVLGTYPYSAPKGNVAWGTCDGKFFRNVYTDKKTEKVTWANWENGGNGRTYTADQIAQISATTGADAKAAMAALDWVNVWFANAGKPELRVFHKTAAQINPADKYTGHLESCTDCGLAGVISVPHTYNASDVCTACGYQKNPLDIKCGVNIEYWDGTYVAFDTTAHAGTEDDPYIIESAEQLAYLALKVKHDVSQGKYYKVSDSIDIMIMQPESIVNAQDVMSLASPDAVKTYFDNLSGKKNWMAGYAWNVFNGSFDGNGVEIYGLYVQSPDKHIGLFPEIDGGGYGLSGAPAIDNDGVTYKNFAVKNSYYSANDKRVGAIIGHTYGPNYGAKVNGVVNIKNCAVVNNYITTALTAHTSGVIIGNADGEVVNIDNCLAYGNNAKNTALNVDLPLFANGYGSRVIGKDAENNDIFMFNTVTNTISIGATPYNQYSFSHKTSKPESFENVYTDKPAGTVIFTNQGSTYTVEFAETDIMKVTNTTGEGIAEVATALDWNNVWFGAAGAPVLRVFHIAFTSTDNGDGTHAEACNCGVSATAVPHNFNKDFANGICLDCGASCVHKFIDINVIQEGDCVTERIAEQECEYCGKSNGTVTTPPAGHNLEHRAYTPETCLADGHIEHDHCLTCDKAFAVGADKFAPMADAIDAVIPQRPHTPVTDSNGAIVYGMDGATHWAICLECNNPIEKITHTGNYVADGANGHTGYCNVCGYGSANVVAHEFCGDATCDLCAWTCAAHTWDAGVIVQEGNCLVDDIRDYTCTICGTVDHRIVVGDGHNFEELKKVYGSCCATGMVAHLHCIDCDGRYELGSDKMSDEPMSEQALTVKKNPDIHNLETVAAVEATCKTAGNKEYRVCKDCKVRVSPNDDTLKLEDKDIIIEAGKHRLTAVALTSTTNAHYTCKDCDKLFADASGKIEVVSEELALNSISGLTINVGGTGGVDNGDTSPDTGDNAAEVIAMVSALAGVAFVLIRKAKKA